MLNSLSLLPGAELSINGDGFTPGSLVTFEVHSASRVLGTSTANADGSIFFTSHIPHDTSPGEHLIYAYDVVKDAAAEITIKPALSLQPPQNGQSVPGTTETDPSLSQSVPSDPDADAETALQNLDQSNNRRLLGFSVISFGAVVLGLILFNARFKRSQPEA